MHLLIELGLLILSYFANRAISNYLLSRQKPPKPGGFDVPTIPAGACIPVVYGTRRVRPIMVWINNPRLVEFNVESKDTIGLVTNTTLGYGYKIDGQFILCWGAIDCVRNMIFGTNEKSLADVPMTQAVPEPYGWPAAIAQTYGGYVFICAAGGPGDPGPHTDSIEAYGGGMAEMQLFLPRIFGGMGRGGMFSAVGGDHNNPYGGTIRLYTGTRRTGPDSIMEGILGVGKVPAYNELTYLVYNDVQIGEGSTPEPVDYIIARYPWDDMVIPGGSGTPVVNSREITGKEWNWVAADCSGAAIIYDLLRNPLYGLGIPDHMINGAGLGSGYGVSGSFEDAQRQLVSEGLGLSMVFSGDRSKAQDAIDEVLRTIDAVLVRDPETFKYRLKLIRNEAINPTALAAIREFTPKQIRELKPVTRNNWRETHNVITVEFSNAEKFYNKDTITVRNEASIAMIGGERPLTVQYMSVTDRAIALRLAARDLKRESLQLWKGTMKTTRVGWDLERGDVFKLTYPLYGFSQMLCRILSVDFGDETDTSISVNWVEDVFNYDDVLRPAEVPPPPLTFPKIIAPLVSKVKTEIVTVAGVQKGRITVSLFDPEQRTDLVEFRTSVGNGAPSAWDVVATATPNTSDPNFPYINPVCTPDLNGDYVYDVDLTTDGPSVIQYQIQAVGYGTTTLPDQNVIILSGMESWAALPVKINKYPVWTVDGGGAVITAGGKCWLTLPAGKLTAWKVQCSPAATATFNLWRNNSATTLPTVADSLGLSFGPTAAEIASGSLGPITIADGDNVTLEVLSNDNATMATVTLTLEPL